MAASSSSMGLRSTRLQVFINFRGGDLRRGFMSFLVPALEKENINVFYDEKELRSKGLNNLFVRIQESKIALAIFSKDYSSSFWCLEELAKMKECMDLGNLDVIPIFYKVEPSIVKHLQGYFGEAFEKLKSRYEKDLERIKKWEEALAYVPQKFGMTFPENSDKKDKEFVDQIVVEVKRMLEHIEGNENQKGRPDTIQLRHPETIQTRQPDTNGHGCMFNVRQLKISNSHNARYWTFETISESANEAAIEIAKMMNRCYFLELCGKMDTKELKSGTMYEVVFVVKVEDTISRWDYPTRVQLMIPDRGLQEREFQFVDLKKNEWIDIQVGVFEARPHKEKLAFYMYQHQSYRMTGIMVKAAIIRSID